MRIFELAMDTEKDKMQWFAMGAPYRNELKVQAALAERGVECFVPMVTHIVETRGRKVKKTEPAVSNLIFVHTTEPRLREIKPSIPRLQYKIFTEEGLNRKIIVRDADMENFILFLSRSEQEQSVRFRAPGEFEFKKGDRVKVIGGPFDGVSGTLLRSSARKSRTLLVELQGLIAASVEISPELLELIP